MRLTGAIISSPVGCKDPQRRGSEALRCIRTTTIACKSCTGGKIDWQEQARSLSLQGYADLVGIGLLKAGELLLGGGSFRPHFVDRITELLLLVSLVRPIGRQPFLIERR